jgi:hypothetical protein
MKKISFNEHLHDQMSVKNGQILRTFGRKFEVYNTEMQFYGQLTVKHLYIKQATDLTLPHLTSPHLNIKFSSKSQPLRYYL